MKAKRLFLFLLVFCSLSCTRSLVYSPSVTPTIKPLKAKELHLQGSLELFPETRPGKIDDHATTLGLTSNLSFGIKDNLGLRLKGWADIYGRQSNIRTGLALSATFAKEKSSDSRLLFIPTIGFAMDGGWFGGMGVGNTIIYQKNLSDKFSLHGGIGFNWGTEGFEKLENSFNEERLPQGSVLTSNLGFGYIVSDKLYFNFELIPMYQINSFDNKSNFLISPSMGFGYILNQPNP